MTGELDKYKISSLALDCISPSGDRVLWSSLKDSPLQKVPTVLSLFFKKRVL